MARERGTMARMSSGALAAALLLGSVALGGVGAPGRAAAAEPSWPDESFAYVVIRQDLRRYLREFARWADVFLNLDRDAQGVVEGPLPPMKPEALLDHLAAENGLYWYFDGAVLHVGPADDIVSRSEPMSPERAAAARVALERNKVLDPRFPVKLDSAAGFISATGPEVYVTRVLAVARSASPDSVDAAPDGAWRRVTIYRAGDASRVRVKSRLGGGSDGS